MSTMTSDPLVIMFVCPRGVEDEAEAEAEAKTGWEDNRESHERSCCMGSGEPIAEADEGEDVAEAI